MFIDDFGFVGINMKPFPTLSIRRKTNFRLQVNGRIVSHGNFTWSDERLKDNVEEIESPISKIMNLKPVSYIYKNDALYGESSPVEDEDDVKNQTLNFENNQQITSSVDNPRSFGFLANEVLEHFPEIVYQVDSFTNAVNYSGLVPILVKVLQEQHEETVKMRSEINKLNDLVESLTKESKNTKGINATLGQNTPNPFSGSSVINYEIQSTFNNAAIKIFDFWGEPILSHNIFSTGQGSFVINAQSLQNGTYHYILVVDDFVVDAKILFVIK